MKSLALIIFATMLFLAGCSSYEVKGKDAATGAPAESVKMGFWDERQFIEWGVPVNRFEFEVRAINAATTPQWVVIIYCKNIDAGESLTIGCDGIDRKFSGKAQDANTFIYAVSADDVRWMANSKRMRVRIEHDLKSDVASLQDGQIAAIKGLFEKVAGGPANISH